MVATPFLLRRSSVLLPSFWGRKLITKLHNIIHKQWIYRNSVIHFKGKDGWTLPEQHAIMSKVTKYSMINPDTILLRHWFLFDRGPWKRSHIAMSLVVSGGGHCPLGILPLSAGVSYSRWIIFLGAPFCQTSSPMSRVKSTLQ
jgi:hypothetical protein